ncbi:MAG: uncharacterized protein C75L2_00380043 [Leptospirillum sp. Group II 'C75']|jgi:hypothetical protein|uniref:Deacylase n=1 Tax=Leptospirillum ferriphilum YSK TaxID=1441628 RepID=A0A059Y060_9BACT|nr:MULTISPECIES: M14 family metallocarboxypeptidase [Leptospirillum]AIA30931.1 deacylase [Leptospirillum ferriphilum YSK]EAY56754.1 MAG: conserved protein of unknown function [Leptospirillum rubarum]EIJ76678.1 MAG: uncharacterized protein C75L2_00380043 [Leptospirillum sp. Group II 'C75']
MEQIVDPETLLKEITSAAEKAGAIKIRVKGQVGWEGKSVPILKILFRSKPENPRVLLSAGIHGDEPAGPHSVLSLLRAWKETPLSAFLQDINLDLFPMINPSGLEKNTRENATGIDLNREFAKGHPAHEVRLLMNDLRHRRYDLSVEFHEDIDARGFYLYEHFPDTKDPFAPSIIARLEENGLTILKDPVIEGMPAQNGIIHPGKGRKRSHFRRHGWPMAIYMFRHGTPRTITLETPTTAPLDQRVRMHRLAFETALEKLLQAKKR